MSDDIVDPREQGVSEDDDRLKVHWTPEEFSLKGKVQVPPKFWYLLIAVLCASLGVSYEEIMETVGI